MPCARFPIYQGFFVAAFTFLSACATAPKTGEFSDRELMAAACPPAFMKNISGSVWTKIESKEISGQFPASVRVEYPKRLAVEVTNLLGAPQAWLTIEDGKTELKFTSKNEQEYGKPSATRDMLGGLPLELAPRLFAGGVPCPSDEKNQDIRIKPVEGGIEVIALDLRSRSSTRYVYHFSKYAGRPWVQDAQWEKLAKTERQGAKSNLVTIFREEPSDSDAAPKRWSASSSRGEIRVRWKERDVTLK